MRANYGSAAAGATAVEPLHAAIASTTRRKLPGPSRRGSSDTPVAFSPVQSS